MADPYMIGLHSDFLLQLQPDLAPPADGGPAVLNLDSGAMSAVPPSLPASQKCGAPLPAAAAVRGADAAGGGGRRGGGGRGLVRAHGARRVDSGANDGYAGGYAMARLELGHLLNLRRLRTRTDHHPHSRSFRIQNITLSLQISIHLGIKTDISSFRGQSIIRLLGIPSSFRGYPPR